MSISISSTLANAGPTADSATNAANAPKPQPAPSPAYTVQLTEAQQVYQLYNQGQRVSQIASGLNLSVAAVNSYLGISNAS